MKTNHKIVQGDSRQMNLLSDKSVHLVITSPPYWQLKDYGSENKTFLNAHLIKEGLAEPDTSVEFKYKEKFLNIHNNG